MRQTKHLQRDALLLSLAGPQPQTTSPVCLPNFSIAPIENQADRPECPKVKVTHSAAFKNPDMQPGDVSRRSQTWHVHFVQIKECMRNQRGDGTLCHHLYFELQHKVKVGNVDVKIYCIQDIYIKNKALSRSSYLQSGEAVHTVRPLLDLHAPSPGFFSGS